MSGTDFYLNERTMAQRVAEEHRQAEARRLLSEARAGHAGWLRRQCCWGLCRLGRFLVSLGQRLLHGVAPQPLPLRGHADGRA